MPCTVVWPNWKDGWMLEPEKSIVTPSDAIKARHMSWSWRSCFICSAYTTGRRQICRTCTLAGMPGGTQHSSRIE